MLLSVLRTGVRPLQRTLTRQQSSRLFSSSLTRHAASAANESEADSIKLGAPVAYISKSDDPWFNLSYEDWKCVVIGRNQNPWKETTPRQLLADEIPLVRRRSGGGTVYHDLGNTNYSIMVPRATFTRSASAELIARAIRDRLAVPDCTVNDRNDVIVREGDKDLKVSGSAYKIIQHRAYHHGTMLISSNTSTLGRALRADAPNLETKGIASYRSPVSTLNAHRDTSRHPEEITHDEFVQAVVAEFAAAYSSAAPTAGQEGVMEMETHLVESGQVQEDKVWNGVKELISWEWQYGQTPEFTNRLTADLSFGQVTADLSSRHALLKSLSLTLSPSEADHHDKQDALNEVASALVGLRYESLLGAEEALGLAHGKSGDGKGMAREVVEWLRASM